jgi:glycosyltransferase involved in cell wall biosynthesis
MKLLMLSNYFTPDFSAGSFRMQGLIDALEFYRSEGLSIDLITTMPNRYATAKANALSYEDRGWLRIHRITLPAHQNGMLDQAIAYFSYVNAVRKLTKNQQWDLVFATSSRLMTAALGAYVSRRVGAPLYLDIRDLFTLNMGEFLRQSPAKTLLPIFRLIEKRSFRHAARLNVVSEGFVSYIRSTAPDAEVRCFTNGIDNIFLSENFARDDARDVLPLILYAGNIGDGQGLHHIVPDVAKKLEGRVRLRVIGDGSKRHALKKAIDLSEVDNVELLLPVAREELIEHYREANILFLHLNELEAFQKVLPSKIFEYAATGRPIVAGVSGYAEDFLGTHLCDVEVFKPLDINAMVIAVSRLIDTEKSIERQTFCDTFSRRNIMESMASDIMSANTEPL